MSGHAALVMRDKVSPQNMRRIHWILAYLRISFQIFLLALCISHSTIRGEFAQSAVGHIAYMMVRLEPVFQQGSMYLTSDEKAEWTILSGSEKIALLLKGHHPWLALELVLLSSLIILFATLRIALFLSRPLQWSELPAFGMSVSASDGKDTFETEAMIPTASSFLHWLFA